MQSRAEKIKIYLIEQIPKHPKTIVMMAAQKFSVTRTTIHRHLNTLLKEKKIIKSGSTRQISYFLATEKNKEFQFSVTAKLSESEVWEKYMFPLFQKLSNEIQAILQYGFTEIFNNAIDHSETNSIAVSIYWTDKKLSLKIQDNGIGVFERIKRTYHFQDPKECLLHLTKGKLTTDPLRHSGEGLFFTSRAFDTFYLKANGLLFLRDNKLDDWTFAETDLFTGTAITMEIDLNSTRKLINIFNKYTELEDFSFNKTDLLVDLSLLSGENLISRSQAKRILERLESFQSITLDFSKVTSVGQGFVDEIFRVYSLKNPHVKINYINANDAVEFMIRRGIPS